MDGGDQTTRRALARHEPLVLPSSDHPENPFRRGEERDSNAILPAHLHIGEEILQLLALSAHTAWMNPVAGLPRPEHKRRRHTRHVEYRAIARSMLEPRGRLLHG